MNPSENPLCHPNIKKLETLSDNLIALDSILLGFKLEIVSLEKLVQMFEDVLWEVL